MVSSIAVSVGSFVVAALAVAVVIFKPLGSKSASLLPESVSEVCGGTNGTVVARSVGAIMGLPEIVATSWGQADGQYSLPPERLVVCADGRAFLWRQGENRPSQKLEHHGAANLFSKLMSFWPQGSARGTEDGNFIWILDEDYNFIVAPTVQERALGSGLRDIKHGDLCPGIDFCGRNNVAGSFRGVARMGGEFNLAGKRNGKEWVMHTKSGYSGSRIALVKATRYYNEFRDANKSPVEIGRNFENCVMKDIFLSRTPLKRVFCYLHNTLGVAAVPGETRRCDITNKSVSVPGHGGLPHLPSCEPREPGNGPACGTEPSNSKENPIVHLVHWIAPGQAVPCSMSVANFDAEFRKISETFKQVDDPGQAKAILDDIKFLRKHSCFADTFFTQQLKCNVHGCFGEGFTQRLKNVEDALSIQAAQAHQLWDGAMQMWERCMPRGFFN